MDCRSETFAKREKAYCYFVQNGIPKLLEELLNDMYYDDPDDIYAYLGNNFLKIAKPATLSKIVAGKAISTQNGIALKASLFCTVHSNEKFICHVITSLQSMDIYLSKEGILEQMTQWINGPLTETLRGCDMSDHHVLETLLSKALLDFSVNISLDANLTGNKFKLQTSASQLGKERRRSSKSRSPDSSSGEKSPVKDIWLLQVKAIASSCVSSLLCKGEAALISRPVHAHVRHLCHRYTNELPEFLITVFHNSKVVSNKLIGISEIGVVIPAKFQLKHVVELAQNLYEVTGKYLQQKTGNAGNIMSEMGAFLVTNFDKLDQSMEFLNEIVNSSETLSKSEINYFIQFNQNDTFDAEKNKYEYARGNLKSGEETVESLLELLRKYTSLSTLIDPFHIEDHATWNRFNARREETACCLFCSFPEPSDKLLQFVQTHPFPVQGIVVQAELMGSVTEFLECHKFLGKLESPVKLMLNGSDSDVDDTLLIDLGIGMSVGQIKLGGITRGERVANLSRLVEIDSELKITRMDEHSDVASNATDETLQ